MPIRHFAVLIACFVATSCRSDTRPNAELTPSSRDGLAAQSEGVPPSDVADAAIASELTWRRVWVGRYTDFYAWSISPDARFASFPEWDTGDLGVRDLVTDSTRRVTRKGTWADSSDYAEVSAFSRDGRRIAYAWSAERDDGYQLRVINTDGSGERVLFANGANVRYVTPEEWSPDDKLILATIWRGDRTNEIALISADNGRLRILKSLDWAASSTLSFSPDGRYVAYDFPPERSSPQRDVYILAVDGSRELHVVTGPANDRVLGWQPDAGGILFYSDRAGTPGIWRLPMRAAQPAGEPVLVRSDVWRLEGIGFGERGYYHGVTVHSSEIHQATIDVAGGRVLSAPTPVDVHGGGFSADWSPDGHWFVYLRLDASERRQQIAIRSVSGDEVREVPHNFETVGLVAWGSDANSLLVWGAESRQRHALHLLNLRDGTSKALRGMRGANGTDWAPDGRTLYSRAYTEGDRSAIFAYAVDSAHTRVLWSLPSGGGFAVSPDGDSLAYSVFDRASKTHRVLVRPLRGGAVREVFRVQSPRAIVENGSLAWTPDGRHLVVAELGTRDRLARLWSVPLSGGQAREILHFQGLVRVRLHPDGRRILFRGGESLGEVWLLERSKGGGGLGQVSTAVSSP
ncbi:MAG: hypothetical protein WD801_05475 [Gemmatimonadaceae bacterium]